MNSDLLKWILTISTATTPIACGDISGNDIDINDIDTCSELVEYFGWDQSNTCEEVSFGYFGQPEEYNGNCGGVNNFYCCCNTGDTLPEDDPGGCTRITDEQQGIDVIVNELENLGFTSQRNDGTWRITLPDPNTGEYSLVIEPDIRFSSNGNSPYSFMEFASHDDPGVGISPDFPFYREIEPGCEERIRREVRSQL